MVIHLHTGPLKACSALELVLRFEPSGYQPHGRWLSHCITRTVDLLISDQQPAIYTTVLL